MSRCVLARKHENPARPMIWPRDTESQSEKKVKLVQTFAAALYGRKEKVYATFSLLQVTGRYVTPAGLFDMMTATPPPASAFQTS